MAAVTGSSLEVTALIAGETCIYGLGTGTTIGTLTEGASPIIDVNAVVRTQTGSGPNCPFTARWTATYSVTEPKPLYVTS